MSNSHSNTLIILHGTIFIAILKKKTLGKSAFGIPEAMIELRTLQYV